MKFHLFPSSERGAKDIGWLKSKFSFSFSDYANPMRSTFGTLIAFNDDLLATEKGFGIHPHANMEIISILLKGKMNHKDSLGYSAEITEGGVQIMSAGTGIFHEEYNIGNEEVSFLQIWIQPKLQNVQPRYQTRIFPKAQRENKLQTIVSGEEGIAHCWINQNSKLSIGYYTTETNIQYPLNPTNKCVFIFNITGELTVNSFALQQKDAIGIWETDLVKITTGKESEFLIIETPVNQK
jgi:quercetin 2,3-dioxygenase